MSYLAAMLAGYDTIHLRLKTTTFSRHDTTDIAYATSQHDTSISMSAARTKCSITYGLEKTLL